jgi:hypothetical protein
MFKNEEEKLMEFKKEYDHISVPYELVDDAILTGFQKAKSAKRWNPRKGWIFSLTAASILLVFLASIRLSPAFADYVTVIPGMEKVVELIRFDKGMMTAIEQDYYQKIGASDERDGLKVSIDGAIADENGLMLFYTLQSNEKQKELSVVEPKLVTRNGEKLDFSSSSYGETHYSEKGKKLFSGRFEYFFVKPFKDKELKLTVKVKGNNLNEIYTIPFTLKKDIQVKKIYKLDKTVTFEGQKITFIDATVYPLRVAIHVKLDPRNTKKLLEFEDLRLVDERGETWNKISDGLIGNTISDDERIIYLQSNYFRKPMELYLVFNKIQAVDKGEANVLVDTRSGIILKQPKENLLGDLQVNNHSLEMNLHVKKNFPFFIFGSVQDGRGKEIESNAFQSGYDDENGVVNIGTHIPNLNVQKSPVSLSINFFPSWIEGNGKIKIK